MPITRKEIKRQRERELSFFRFASNSQSIEENTKCMYKRQQNRKMKRYFLDYTKLSECIATFYK